MDYLKAVETDQINENLPNLSVGNEIKVHFKIIEGKVERVQIYQGVIIKMANCGTRKTITVRKISDGIGIERIFPLNSPKIVKIEIVKVLKVRRSKLYFLRKRRGKSARLKEVLKKKS